MIAQPDILAVIRTVGGDAADLPFWRACRDGRFLVHRCAVCGRSYWPASRCVMHGDEAMAWMDASGRGMVYTYTILHRALTPAMALRTPYAVAVVKLEEGPFFHSNIVKCDPAEVFVGMQLEVLFETQNDGLMLPVFQRVV